MTGLARSGAARPAIPSQGMAGWARAVELAPEAGGVSRGVRGPVGALPGVVGRRGGWLAVVPGGGGGALAGLAARCRRDAGAPRGRRRMVGWCLAVSGRDSRRRYRLSGRSPIRRGRRRW